MSKFNPNKKEHHFNIISFDLTPGLGEKNLKILGQFKTTYKKCLYEAVKLGLKKVILLIPLKFKRSNM